MTPRRVVITIEVTTDALLADIVKAAQVELADTDGRPVVKVRRGEELHQIQANVIAKAGG